MTAMTALSVTARNWKQPKCVSIGGYIHTKSPEQTMDSHNNLVILKGTALGVTTVNLKRSLSDCIK